MLSKITLRNDFKFRFINKDSGRTSYHDLYCCGDLFKYIDKVKDDLTQLCLSGVSNDTHDLLEVVWLYNNEIVWRNKDYV